MESNNLKIEKNVSKDLLFTVGSVCKNHFAFQNHAIPQFNLYISNNDQI